MKRLYASSKSARRSAHASGFCGTWATAQPDIRDNDATRNNFIHHVLDAVDGKTPRALEVIPPPPRLRAANRSASVTHLRPRLNVRPMLSSDRGLTSDLRRCTSESVSAGGGIMDIKPSGSVPSRRMPDDWFTGTVWQDPIIEAPTPARIRAGRVSFEPGARTAWHTHPLGQTLHVVSGLGRVQSWGGPIREIRPGDTVWIPPGEKHWHGASPTTAMAHIAMQEALDGTHVTWMEHVSDAQYGGKVG